MVAVFLRLRLRQLANSLRRPPLHLLGLAIILGYAIVATVFAVRFLGGLRSADVELAGSVVVIGGSILTFGFLLVPLFFGADDPADPRAVAPLGIPATQVATGLAAAGLISVPTVLLIVIAGAQVATWVGHPDASAVAVFGAIIIVVTGVLGARLARSIAAFWLHGKRARDIAGLIAVAGLLALTPAIVGIAATDWEEDDAIGRLSDLADVLGGTPIGAAWSAPAAAAAGDGGAAWVKLLGATVFALVLWAGWRILVARMLVTPQRPANSTRSGGLGWFAWLPGTPVGAVAARSFTYWVRDGRYRLALIAIPIVPMLLIPPFLIAGVWWQNLALIPLPVMCLFLGWIVHNDTASDNTAVWLHIASNTSGWVDRFGRVVPPLLVGMLLIAIGAPLTSRLYGVPEVLPSVLGVSLCVLLAGLGLSSYVSARHPYPTVRPGDSPFAQPQSTTTSSGQALSFFGTIVLALPALGFAAMGLVSGGSWHFFSFATGLVIGVGVFYLGLSAGARVFATRAPELLAFSLRN